MIPGCALGFRSSTGSALLRSLGGRGFSPGANHPKQFFPHPFLHPNPRTGDFNRHERLFPLFSSRVSEARLFASRVLHRDGGTVATRNVLLHSMGATTGGPGHGQPTIGIIAFVQS